jgi:hypothetical protein
MRSFVAALTLALLTVPAYSQGGRKHQPQDHAAPTEDKKPRVDEKDYKSALDRIPAAEQKVDPWGNVREPPKRK